ncbi:MAG: hypothetical protein ACYCZJ_14930 [Sulfuriferula sp.]
MAQSFRLLALVLAGMALLGNSAMADDKHERALLRRVQLQMQQVEQEKAALQQQLTGFEQEKSTLSNEKGALAKKLQSAESRATTESRKSRSLEQELEAARKDKQALQEQKSEVEKRLAAMTAQQAESARQLTMLQGENKQVESNLSMRERQVTGCEDKNLKLYQYGRDLIKQCRDHSATDVILRLEPVTGIGHVEIENMLEEYRDKLDAQKLISSENRK